MSADPSLLVEFAARQFDHWDADASRGDDSIAQSLEWIEARALRNRDGISGYRVDS